MSVSIVKNEPQNRHLQVLVLFGSPHKDGHTAKLLQAFLQQLPPGCSVDQIDAFSEHVMPCNGCQVCHKSINCIYPDFDHIMLKIEQADVIVVATPVYFLSMPAPLKAMIDRFQLYWSARFVHHIKPFVTKKKQGYLLMTTGSDDESGFEIIEKQTRMAFSIINTIFVGSVAVSSTDWQTSDTDMVALTKDLAKTVKAF